MNIYTIDEEDLNQISEATVEYEQELQSHLLKASGAEIGDLKMMYVSEEGTPFAEGGFFDILGVDENGETVIVELKRGKTPRQVVSQALEYASGIRKEEYHQLDERFEAFRRSRGANLDASLRQAHANFFDLEDGPLAEREFNTDIHLVVVAAEFSDATLNMADLLREHDLDVVCVRYQTFADPEKELTLLTMENIRRPLALEPGNTSNADLTPMEELQEEFWQQVIEKIDERTGSDLYTNSTNPRSYLPVQGTLPDDADIALGTDSLRGQLQVKLHLRDETGELYEYLREHKSEIEAEVAEDLIWDAESAEYDQIRLVRDGSLKSDREDWDEFQDWLIDYWETFDEVFGEYLRRRTQ